MAYEDFLNEIVRFLVEHPTEIIVVQVSLLNGFCLPTVGRSTERHPPLSLWGYILVFRDEKKSMLTSQRTLASVGWRARGL